MIPLALVAFLLPTPTDGVPVPTPPVQTNGPRPNRDPDAIPDGKRITGDTPVVNINLSAVSDYRFRGITQTDGDPAVQGSVEATAPSGIYAGLWGSTIAAYEGAHTEVDVYGGYRTVLSGWSVDVGIISYLYPGADNVSSAEIYGSGAHAVGDGEVKLGISYTPHQAQLGDTDGLYVFTDVSTPLPRVPVTVRAHLGREAGVNTTTDAPKIDWLVGADFATGPVTLSLAWVDARYRGRLAEEDSKGRLVAALALDF
ncbi:TorF family putative porin [Sphingomonas floccifaciens]|uniref:TorF family putative porin n=1 Tax=Sphingomonas floccifaciens TaxID=1844115 RepID=A0ABW4N773_9SPHN